MLTELGILDMTRVLDESTKAALITWTRSSQNVCVHIKGPLRTHLYRWSYGQMAADIGSGGQRDTFLENVDAGSLFMTW